MEFIDPFNFITPEKYGEFWYRLLTVVLKGFWVRFFAFVSLLTGIWLMIVRRNAQVGWVFVMISVTLTYLIGIIMFFFRS